MIQSLPTLNQPLKPPSTVKVTSRFDWFTLVGDAPIGDVKSTVGTWFGAMNESTGGDGYRRRYFTDERAILFEGNIRNEARWAVSIPGETCARLDESIKGPVLELIEMGAAVSRVDAAVDVYDEGRELVREMKRRITEFSKAGWLKKSGSGHKGRGSDIGWTEYLGSVKSDRFVRVYDKGAKEETWPDYWLRFEAVIKGKWARAVTPMLTADADWGKVSRGLAATLAEELRNVDQDMHEILFGGELSPVTVEMKRTTLDGFVDHCRRSSFGTLAMMAEAEGMTLLEAIVALNLDKTPASNASARHSGLLTDWACMLSDGKVHS